MSVVEIRKAVNAADVATQAATETISSIRAVLSKKNSCHLALTGGTVGVLTLAHLAKDPEIKSIDFTKVHFWWGDERFVESTSLDRNANQAKTAFLDHINVPAENVHEFPSSDLALPLNAAALLYEEELQRVFGADEVKMDITHLGMGPDGHVASLFPGRESWPGLIVAESDSPKPPAERLSMSLELINKSSKIIFVVSGIDKAEAFEQVHQNDLCQLPAAKVSARDETLWIVDEAAGAAFWSC